MSPHIRALLEEVIEQFRPAPSFGPLDMGAFVSAEALSDHTGEPLEMIWRLERSGIIRRNDAGLFPRVVSVDAIVEFVCAEARLVGRRLFAKGGKSA